MKRAVFIFAVIGGVSLASLGPSLRAETAAPGNDDTRYSFHSVDDGFVRLDARTGQTSLCSRDTAGWSCRAMADDRVAFDEEIARLQGENAALKKTLLDHGLPLPSGIAMGQLPAAPDANGRTSPEDAGFHRAMVLMQRVWRRLVEMMADVRHDLNRS